MLVELLRPPGRGWLLPEKVEAELEAIARKRQPASEDSTPEEAAE